MDVRDTLLKLGFSPKKSLGQNFLVDKRIIDKMVNSFAPDVFVVEIGGGTGALTIPLAQKVQQLVSIEKDELMVHILKTRLDDAGLTNVRVINKDVLDLVLADISFKTFQICGSLPYYITSPIIHKFVNDFYKYWSEAVFLIQKDVAIKITTGQPHASYWFNYLNYFYEVEFIVRKVPPSSFWPQPVVNSSVIKLVKKHEKLHVSPNEWSKFLHMLFKHPRKQLGTYISRELLMEAEIDPTIRAQELSMSDVELLFELLSTVPLNKNKCQYR